MELSRAASSQDFGSALGYWTKTTMCHRINKITKLRPYRQDLFGGVSSLLITKAIHFWLKEPQLGKLLKTSNEHASIKDSWSKICKPVASEAWPQASYEPSLGLRPPSLRAPWARAETVETRVSCFAGPRWDERSDLGHPG